MYPNSYLLNSASCFFIFLFLFLTIPSYYDRGILHLYKQQTGNGMFMFSIFSSNNLHLVKIIFLSRARALMNWTGKLCFLENSAFGYCSCTYIHYGDTGWNKLHFLFELTKTLLVLKPFWLYNYILLCFLQRMLSWLLFYVLELEHVLE